MKNSDIHNIIAREILDSRGNPTVEVDVITENGIADLRGKSSKERAIELVEKAAADQFKEELFSNLN